MEVDNSRGWCGIAAEPKRCCEGYLSKMPVLQVSCRRVGLRMVCRRTMREKASRIQRLVQGFRHERSPSTRHPRTEWNNKPQIPRPPTERPLQIRSKTRPKAAAIDAE